MDWLTFKFCVLIWVLGVSKSHSQLLNSSSIEQECINGEEIPATDACNTCICRRGKVTCTNMICIPAPNCVEKQLYPSENDCNACMCENGFIKCTSNGCLEENLPAVVNTTSTTTPEKTKRCTEGSPLPAPIECLECFCENGRKRCKYICNQTVQMETRFADTSEPACFPGQTIPSPDDCNHCLCFEGEIHCTHRPCQTYMRIGRQCGDEQMVIQFDECNECYCIEGQLECSNLICIRGSKCVQGQEIPKPDSCNACVCVDGHIVCTNSECPLVSPRNAFIPERTATELKQLNDECQDGDVLPTLPPPYDCNKCFCIDNIIMCTMNSCVESKSEINGRLKEQNEQTYLKNFDKQISVEPFIDVLYKNKDKLPSKVIHTHAYNGYHQEIKVQAKHLPKDATNLFKVLASSLDNSALASISQKLLTSSDSTSRNPDSKIPFNHQEVQNNLLGEGNVLTTHSNKIITSGSQSNETILVIPSTEPFDYKSPKTVLPLTNKHEIIWKSVSAPAPIVYHNNQPINPRNSKDENLNFYNEDRPPSFLTSIPQNDIIREPTKFSRPGLQPALPTKPSQDILQLPNLNTQSNPLNPKPINNNDGNINYTPYYPDNNQFKPFPSGFVGKGDELPQRPLYQPTKPAFIAPNINGVQPKPSQSLYVPNLPKYYPNPVKPQQFQFKPNQNLPNQILLPTSINKGIQLPPLFSNIPNQPIVNQYNPPQFGLKPGLESPLNNIGNQTYQQFNQFPPNFPMNPPVINLPLQKKRISSIESEGSKEITTHSTLPSTNILNPQQNGVSSEYTQHNKPTYSQFVPNPSIYYKNEFEAPKINEVNPEDEQLILNSNYNQPHTSSKLDNEANIPKVHNKKRKYNTTHSHYEKHSSVIYVSENDPDHPKIVGHDSNQGHDVPHTNEYEQNIPNQDSQELYLTIQLDEKEPYPKLTDYNPSQTSSDPGMIKPDSWNVTTYQFDKYPHSTSDGKNTDQIKSNQNRTNPTIPVYPNILGNYPQTSSQFINEGLNDPVFADGSRSPANSVKGPTHQKSQPQIASIQNQNQPEILNDRGSSPEFQYTHNAYEDPRLLKPVHNLPPSNLETPDNNNLSGMLDERGSDVGFLQYPSNSAENLLHPKQNIQKPTNSLYGPTQTQHLPGMFDERGSAGGFQYPYQSAKYPSHPNQNIQKPTNYLYSPTQKDINKSSHFVPYKSNVDPAHLKDNLHMPPHPQFGPTQNQFKPYQYGHNANQNPTHLKPSFELPNFPFDPTLNQNKPGTSKEFQNSPNSAENPIHTRGFVHTPSQPILGPAQIPNLLGMFKERGNNDSFHNPYNSAENPSHSIDKLNKPLQTQFGPTQHQPILKVFDARGSASGFQYPSNSAEQSIHPKDSLNNPSYPKENLNKPSPFGFTQNQPSFHYPSHSTGNPSNPKQKLSYSQNQHLPGMFDERGSVGGLQYPSHSAEDPSHPKQSMQKPTNSLYGPTQNQHLPGMFDGRGSADDFQYPSHTAEDPSHPKQNMQKPTNSLYDPTQKQHLPGMFDERGSAGGLQYPSHSAEDPSHPKQSMQKPINSLYGPTQNQHLPGMFDGRGSADGFQYPFNSAENPLQTNANRPYNSQSQFLPSNNHYKENIYKPSYSQFGPTQNKHLQGMFDERGSTDGFQYPAHSAENPLQTKDNYHQPPQTQFLPSNKQFKENIYKQPSSPFVPTHNQHSAEDPTNTKDKLPNSLFGPSQDKKIPGMFDERGSADGFQYTSNSAEDPDHQKNNPDTTADSELKQSQNQPEHLSLDDSNIPKPYSDKAENQPDTFSNLHPKNNNYNNNNPLRPWIHLDHDQYKPSSFDNLLNGIHNIPWSDPDDHKDVSNIVTSTPRTSFEPDHDQYKPLSLDNPLNGVHDIPLPILNQDNDALGTDAIINPPLAGFKPKQDQYEPSMIKNPSLPLSNQHDISDGDGNELPTEQDIPDAFLELTNPRPEIKPDNHSDNDHPIDDGKTLDYYDQLYPLYKAVKKLSYPPIDDSEFSVDQLDLLPYLLPGIAKILNYEPVKDQDDALPVEDRELKRIYPLSKLKSILKQQLESGNAIFKWLQSKLNKVVPTKYNVTVIKNDIDMTKIFHLLKNFTRPSVKDNVKLQNIPSNGYDPEIIKNIQNVFQEDILTTTPSDLTDAFDNRFKSEPTESEEIRQQAKQIKYPDVHIILHQPLEEDYMDIPPYTQTDDAANLATDMGFEGLDSPLFSKILNARFRHRPKDQKDECGDGTHWISKCHGCSCNLGRPMCLKMHDCELRPFGEPMSCKPYSHFNMGCYTCECNGDGVAECDSTDCTTEPSGKSKVSETTEPTLPVFNEFYDSKNTNEILQYYNFYKKLPKVCPKQDLQTQYPTCERGTSWVSSCHKCECNESGKHKCVKIDDCTLDFDSYGKPGRCKPNTKFYPKTNSMPCVECTCTDEGNPYCPTADYKKH